MAVARIVNKLLFRTRRFFFYPYLHCAPLSPIVSHYSKPHLLSPGVPDEHVNFQATSSMSLWPRTAITNVVSCLVKRLSLEGGGYPQYFSLHLLSLLNCYYLFDWPNGKYRSQYINLYLETISVVW